MPNVEIGVPTVLGKVLKLGKFLRRRIASTAAALLSRLRDSECNRSIILVYSMGKVGSASVYFALKKRLPVAKIVHLHFLSDHWLKDVLPGLDTHFHNNIELGKDTLQYIRDHPEKRIKIVTLVREPVVREISDAFQNWKGLFPGKESLDQQFLSDWMDSHTHEYTLSWFDTEFRNFTGFDIYATPFDFKRGYTIYQLEKMDILCLKLERLNDVFEEAFKRFLNINGLSMRSENSSSDKSEKELYALVRKYYRPDPKKLDFVYSSKYMRHFYSDHEIRRFVDQWKREPAKV